MASEVKRPGGYYWLIVKQSASGQADAQADVQVGAPEIFSMGFAEQECLPVFSFREEAEMFLRLRSLEDDWGARKSGSGELLSLLSSSLSGVEQVALDPLPEISDNSVVTNLISMSRKGFMNHLLVRMVRGRSWLRGRGGRSTEEGYASG